MPNVLSILTQIADLLRQFVDQILVWVTTLARETGWPFAILVILLTLMLTRSAAARLGQAIPGIRSLKGLGFEFVLSEEGAQRFSMQADEVIEDAKRQLTREYRGLAVKFQLRDKLEAIINEAKLLAAPGKLRFTVHVPGVLIDETLYQILDYYPSAPGGGRAFSMRFGMAGRAWRLRKSQINGDVPTDPNELVEEWGMTKEEAADAASGRKSMLSIVLTDQHGTAVGVLYGDSTDKLAFGADLAEQMQLIEQLEKLCTDRGLVQQLKEIREKIPVTDTLIRVRG
jgi:hypothetical protein